MTVDGTAIVDALLEQRLAAVQEAMGQPPYTSDDRAVEDAGGERHGLVEAGVPPSPEPPEPGLLVDLCGARGGSVGGGELVSEVAQCVADVGPCADERGQPPVVRHPAHHDYGLVFAAGKDEVGYAEVDVGGEAAVELHLPAAGVCPLLGGAEVQEAEVDGLLELVGTVADEEQAGTVGLAQGEVVGFGEGSHEIASRCRLVRLSPMVLTSRGPR